MNLNEQTTEALPERISCLVLSLAKEKLLVPVTAVAEVVNTRERVESAAADGALYGWIHWRDQRIPLASLDLLLGAERTALAVHNDLLILNAIGALAELGFYAVRLQGLPTPVQVDESNLRGHRGEGLVMANCEMSGERLLIPDFAALETAVAQLVG
ncbi:MAG: chemotaxis protein CheW [Porticoccaceae bacterium]